jgi:hypothetical protein
MLEDFFLQLWTDDLSTLIDHNWIDSATHHEAWFRLSLSNPLFIVLIEYAENLDITCKSTYKISYVELEDLFFCFQHVLAISVHTNCSYFQKYVQK